MPDRPHHTDKMKRCVDDVMAKGHDKSSAYAICTTSLQKAGEPIFEGAESRSAEENNFLWNTGPEAEVRMLIANGAQMHHLHLLGATGTPRTEIENGKEYLVVPVVALMEGVIHAVNADTPEFVSYETLEKAATSWNGRPVTLGHPVRNGKQCSANHPEILEAHGIGVIRNSHVDLPTKKLLQEAWIEKSKAKKLHPEMYNRLLNNQTEEVSVGAYVITDDVPGAYNGKEYKASWRETSGDHLAFLPGGRGACSVAMGCGTHRAAAMRVCEDHLELLAAFPEKAQVVLEKKKKYQDCPVCHGTGSKDGNPCEVCDGNGEIRVASISTSSKSEKPSNSKSIPAAAKDVSKPQLRAACGCKQEAAGCGCKKAGAKPMEKATRAELIAALVTDRFSGFTEVDEAMLETASDSRLEDFKALSDARKAEERSREKQATELTKANARLSIAEERLRAAQESPSEEEWLSKAPPKIKALLDAHKAEEDALRASLVSQLKDCGANTESELKAMPIEQLKTLAAYARIEVVDFSGRGIPQERNASSKNVSYAPPDPYAPHLDKVRKAMVN